MKTILRRWKQVLITLLVIAGWIFIIVYFSTERFSSFGGLPDKKYLLSKASSNYDGKKFVNPIKVPLMAEGVSYWQSIKRWFFGEEERVPKEPPPIVVLSSMDYQKATRTGLRVTWMGHSTVLIEIDGKRIMTDPVWSAYCSPFTWLGPHRFHDMPINLDNLPYIDFVLISHDHYDHLDKQAVSLLAKKGTQFVVPLGVGAHFKKWGIASQQVTELDWQQSVTLATDIKIVATPAIHYSGRSLVGKDKTLWASWVIASSRHKVFFSGDTGYYKGFEDVGKEYGPFDLTMIKIGAYGEDWPAIHLNPKQAVEVHKMLKGKMMLPLHWGTFNLAYHAWDEPIKRTVWHCDKQNVALVTPKIGQLVEPEDELVRKKWWEALDE